jgi:two-component system, NarL family, sensor histidine kinase UhpB
MAARPLARLLGGRAGRRERRRPRGPAPLFRRVFAVNAVVLGLAAAVTVLVFSPGAVTPPVAYRELAILAAALAAMLVLNLMLTRRALAPLEKLRQVVERVDLLRPGQRVSVRGGAAETIVLADAFNEMLERLEAEREESVSRALDAQESERLRVARELHDEVGQQLTAVLLLLDRTARRVPPEHAQELREAQEAARASLEDIKRIAQRLRPEALDDLGLVSALTALSEPLAEQAGVRVERRFARELPPLSREQELVIYRVAQEALTNVVRHAGAGRVELSLEADERAVRLRVADDGRGLTGGAPAAGGIRGMYERALMVGAELTVGNGRLGGAEVCLELPLARIEA